MNKLVAAIFAALIIPVLLYMPGDWQKVFGALLCIIVFWVSLTWPYYRKEEDDWY